jgi:hypothetical protein
LPAIPVPPRSVIIERLPAAPPRPRDIVIERWIPYGPRGARRTIVQRAGAARAYAAPRNVIIQYEPAQVRVVRNFQRLGVVQANPTLYLQQYGATLLDAGTLLAQARAAGVVEDISAPGGAVGYSGASWGQEGWGVSSGLVGGANVVGGGVGLVGGGAGLVTGGAELVDAGVVGGLGSSSVYESSSYSSGGVGGLGGGVVGGLGAGYGAGYGGGYGASWGSSGYSAGGVGGVSGVDGAFAAADTNTDGTLDQGEFRQFLSQNL